MTLAEDPPGLGPLALMQPSSFPVLCTRFSAPWIVSSVLLSLLLTKSTSPPCGEFPRQWHEAWDERLEAIVGLGGLARWCMWAVAAQGDDLFLSSVRFSAWAM